MMKILLGDKSEYIEGVFEDGGFSVKGRILVK